MYEDFCMLFGGFCALFGFIKLNILLCLFYSPLKIVDIWVSHSELVI